MSSDLKSRILSDMTPTDYKSYYESQLGVELSKMNTAGWTATNCCFHSDLTPSLNISFLKEGAYRCHGCSETGDLFTFHMKKNSCSFKDALRFFANLKNIDINENPDFAKAVGKRQKKAMGTLDHVYQYIDLDGKVRHETVRYINPKDFRQRRPHPTEPDKYIWKLEDTEVIPYNLPGFFKSSFVYLVEGEKDVDNLTDQGLPATCNPMGAGKWWDSMTPYFQDKTVYILPDNDDPGKAHASLVAQKLKDTARAIHIVKLPELPPGGDVSDWLAAGNTKADLFNLIKNAKPYQSHIDMINSKHAGIMIGGDFFVLNEEWDPIFNRKTVTFSREKDLRARYSNQSVPNPRLGEVGQPRTINIVQDWMTHPDRRYYDYIVFDPSNSSPSNCYNYWTGFALEPKPGDWSLLRSHIHDNICGGNTGYFDWLICWMARIVQDPGGKRPGTAVVLRGEQGVGKGVFVSNFGAIFGSHYLQMTNQAHLTGRFNAHMRHSILLFVDEGFWAGDKASEGLIKGLVTEDIVLIESKYKDAMPLKNHVNLIIASNNEWVVPSGLDERRFFCLDVSNSEKQNSAYFDPITRQMESGGREAMMYDLLHHPIDIDIRKIPRTDALFDQIVDSMSPVQRFWLEILRRGTLEENESDWSGKIFKHELHTQYLDWCDCYNVRMKFSPVQFGKRINKLFPPSIYTRYEIPESSKSSFQRKWRYYFPDLLTCRTHLQEILKMGIDFDRDEGFDPKFEGL